MKKLRSPLNLIFQKYIVYIYARYRLYNIVVMIVSTWVGKTGWPLQ